MRTLRAYGLVFEARSFIAAFVTPGVRSTSVAEDDQRRVMTAAEAIWAGADYLVVGRPILNSADPGTAARGIVAEIDGALRAPQAQTSR